MGKTTPLNDDDLAEFLRLQKTFADSEKSWIVSLGSPDDDNGFDISAKNPKNSKEVKYRTPQEIIKEMSTLDSESARALTAIQELM